MLMSSASFKQLPVTTLRQTFFPGLFTLGGKLGHPSDKHKILSREDRRQMRFLAYRKLNTIQCLSVRAALPENACNPAVDLSEAVFEANQIARSQIMRRPRCYHGVTPKRFVR